MFRSYTETIRTNRDTKPSQSLETLQAYACDLCDDNYWHSETDVELHRKEVHLPIIREQLLNHPQRFCTVCMTLHESKNDLLNHIKSSHLLSSSTARRVEREIFICDHCNNILFNKAMLEAHIMYHHLWKTSERAKKTFSCPKCKKTIKLRFIWFHLQIHEIPSLSVCEICLSHCENIRELHAHMKSHNMFYKCEICNYHTMKELHFEGHLDKHHNSEVLIKSSNKLGKAAKLAFTRQSSPYPVIKYNMHHTLKGLELPRFIRICTLCREICTDKMEMKTHMARDHSSTSPPRRTVRCLCGKEFFNRVLLKHHLFKTGNEGEFHRELAEGENPILHLPKEAMIEVEISNVVPTVQSQPTSKRQNLPETEIIAEARKEILTKQGILTKISADSEIQALETYKETFDTAGETFDTPGETFDTAEETFDTPGETFDTPGETFDTPGETFDTPGETFDTAGESPDERQTEKKRTEVVEIGNGEVVDPGIDIAVDELTVIYAEIDDGELVTIESQPNEQVLGI